MNPDFPQKAVVMLFLISKTVIYLRSVRVSGFVPFVGRFVPLYHGETCPSWV